MPEASVEERAGEPSAYGAAQPGAKLGRYELLVPVARGGMARVWAARLNGQRGFQKLVAIKTILPHLAAEPEFERMFLDEARIASCVHHPNVCEIYELGEEAKTLYLVMEWVSGDSLARLLRPSSSSATEAIDPRVAARIIADACAGLHAAHELADDDGRELGVVHRDLSPHNILLTSDGVAKVADFGVAKAYGQLHEATNAGQLKGKLAYMAPEQVSGAPIDRRSDVFALGCVLYEATTGARPFRGDVDVQIMRALLAGEFTPPSRVVPGYPAELEAIVMRALAPSPVARFATAERMRFALEEFLARGPLVTQANVAHLLRSRLDAQLERRKEKIRLASATGDDGGRWTGTGTSTGLSMSSAAQSLRSGVQPARGAPDASGAYEAQHPVTRTERPPAADAYGATRAGAPIPSHAPHAMAIHASAVVPSYPGGVDAGAAPQQGAGYAVWPSPQPVQPATTAPTRHEHPFAPASDASPRRSSSSHYGVAIGVGILVAVLIGGGAFATWKLRTATKDGAAPTPTTTPVRSDDGVATPSASEVEPSPQPTVESDAPGDTPAAHAAGDTPAAHPASDAPAAHPASDAPAAHPASDAPAAHPASDAPAAHAGATRAKPSANTRPSANTKSKPRGPSVPANPY